LIAEVNPRIALPAPRRTISSTSVERIGATPILPCVPFDQGPLLFKRRPRPGCYDRTGGTITIVRVPE
jgi:hypothetical protein